MTKLFCMPSRTPLTVILQTTLGLFVLIGMVFWYMQALQWSSPLTKPVAVTPLNTPSAAQMGQWQQLLMGVAAPATHNLEGATNTQWAQWQLLGVVSSEAGFGIAMLANPAGEELLVRTLEALLPGIFLLEVHDQHVLVGPSLQDSVTLKLQDALN
jgi:hypothetical protein